MLAIDPVEVREASEELSAADDVILALATSRESGDGGGINDRDVVSTGEGDGEGALSRCAVVVGDGVVDVDGLSGAFCESLIGVIAWVEGPGAIGVDG